jgi:beta-glucosidase
VARTEIDRTEELAGLVAKLSLADKVRLLTGRDLWSTWPLEQIGLRSMVLSDGPSGVRGERWDERDPSLSLPSGTALASAWDRELAWRYGAVLAGEADRKGVDVVLGPTVNLHRSPLGGRHFEALSEDPVLTADIAAALVAGLQDNGIAATPKHYVANDFETERFTVDVQVSDRALREVYLLAFEKAVAESSAWLVMSSYNSINGATATENDLLETPLNSEWGFDGVVVSDWTAVRSVASAAASQDLAMPGPGGAWGDKLVAAVEAGEIDESAIDRKVLRILHLAARVGALEGIERVARPGEASGGGTAFAREAAAAGSVLLRNQDGELPWAAAAPSRIAVIGHNAKQARTSGGGSATVLPERVLSPLAGIAAAFPDAAVDYSLGAIVQVGLADLALEEMTNPVTGEPGMRLRYLDADGGEVLAEDRLASSVVLFDAAIPAAAAQVELSVTYRPEASGRVRLGVAAAGHCVIQLDGESILDETINLLGGDPVEVLTPPSASVPFDAQAGRPADVVLTVDLAAAGSHGMGRTLAVGIGTEPDAADEDALIAEAAAVAAAADVAVVVVGTNAKVESEGFDRTSLTLPGRQDDLVRAVVAANPRTVVVINAGSPVLLPWADDVAAVLLTYFGGQELGGAIGDILAGTTEPGGRLPTSWPSETSDVPVLDVTPDNGVMRYEEGIHIGYRAWLRAGRTPRYEFGHGLGYTTWSLDGLTGPGAVAPGGTATLQVTLRNTGSRPGKQVVQVYAERASSDVERPLRWLVGFAAVTAAAGERVTAEIGVPTRLLAHWSDGWQYEVGDYLLRAGTSVSQLPLEATLRLE